MSAAITALMSRTQAGTPGPVACRASAAAYRDASAGSPSRCFAITAACASHGQRRAGIFEEASVDELEHHALPTRVRDGAVQGRRGQQRRVGPRVQVDDRVEPGREPAVVESHERDARARLAVVRLEAEHEQLRERRLVTERGDAKDRDGRDRLQVPYLGPGIGPPRVPSNLNRERRGQHQPYRRRHRGDAPLTRPRPSCTWVGKDAHSALR